MLFCRMFLCTDGYQTPASRLQQILGILDSDVIVTSEKYLKDLEKLGSKERF